MSPSKPRPARLTERHIFGFLPKLFHLWLSSTFQKSLKTQALYGFKPFLTFARAFDFGTRPHGLFADAHAPVQEGHSPTSQHSLADAFDVSGRQVDAKQLPRAGALGATAMPEGLGLVLPEKRGGHTFNFTEEERCAVVFALINQMAEIEESDEANHPELVEELHYLESAWQILRVEGEFR